jgi:hypothetical protein
MNRRLASCLATFSIALIGILLACIALLAIPQALATPAPPFAEPAATLQPAAVPTSSTECPNGDCAKACVSQLSDMEQSSSSSEARAKAADQGARGAPAKVLVTYPVNGDQLGAPKYSDHSPAGLSGLQSDKEAQQKIWDYFAAIIPAEERADLIYYVVATDGKGHILASVEHFSGQSDSWGLLIDPADASKPRDLTFTLLHEFGHLLTLNGTQVTPNQAVLRHPEDLQIYEQQAASCPQYFASGGCSLSDSYINQFFDEFWTKLFDEWSAVNAARTESNYHILLSHFYRDHASEFITPYAATSPEEDMAESWSYFVLTPKPVDDSTAHRKLLFFYNFPELVDLRDKIVSNICSYASSQ